MPTISDEQAAQIRQLLTEGDQAKAALKGAQELWNDPTLGDQAKALWRKKWPDAVIPGYDEKQQLQSIVDAERTRIEEGKRNEQVTAEENRMRQQRAAVQKKRGYTDEAMQRMDQLMGERKIYDYEAGDLLFAAQNPTPSDGTSDYDGHFMNYDRHPEAGAIAKDPERWGFDQLVGALNRDTEQRKRNRF